MIWGALFGALGGLALGGWLGAVVGAIVYAPLHVLAQRTKKPAAPGPLWGRIVSSALLMAPVGWLLGLVLGPLAVGLICGALIGALGLRPWKLTLGLAVGCLGVIGLSGAWTAALVTVVYRSLSAYIWRKRPLVRIMAEAVPAEELLYVVPFEARSRYVGADYVEQLAHVRGGTFQRNPPDVGILASLDALHGPTFNPEQVHPLIREFYEHTSRFKLSIVPEWRRWMKPGYELFKRVVAEPLGQAAIPSNIEEAQRGMVSTIDTIDLDGDDEIDIRGWIRTFADDARGPTRPAPRVCTERAGRAPLGGKPIYVGIYTTFRHEDRGYVSVGFPIPSSNFTATLLPRNIDGDGLLLSSRSELPFPGHYLSAFDDQSLSVIKLLAFHEQIHVFVVDGELKTEHSFSLAGQRFLTLHYTIERLPDEP